MNIQQKIASIKWPDGFICRHCNGRLTIKARNKEAKRCASCKRIESVTAHTVFDKLRMPLEFAYWIVEQIAIGKRIKSTQIAQSAVDFGVKSIRQKTVWDFMNKVYSRIPEEDVVFTNRLFIYIYDLRGHRLCILYGKAGKEWRYQGQFLKDHNPRTLVQYIVKHSAEDCYIRIIPYQIWEQEIGKETIPRSPLAGYQNPNNDMDSKVHAFFLGRQFSSQNAIKNLEGYLKSFIYGLNYSDSAHLMNYLVNNPMAKGRGK